MSFVITWDGVTCLKCMLRPCIAGTGDAFSWPGLLNEEMAGIVLTRIQCDSACNSSSGLSPEEAQTIRKI